MKSKLATEKFAEQIGKFLIETYLDKRLNELENKIEHRFKGIESQFQGLRDKVEGLNFKVDGLNSKDEAIKILVEQNRYVFEELKKKSNGKN